MLHTTRLNRYLQVGPLVLLVVVLTIFPTLYAYYISAHKVILTRLDEATFIGLQNYSLTLGDPEFWQALWFSVRYAILTVIVEGLVGLGIALWFNRRKLPGRGILLSFMLLPIMVSPALLGIMFRLMLNEFVGPLAYYLKVIGLPGARLLTPDYILLTLVIIDVAQWTPFTFLILYSALQTVPKELYEAAAVDGASALQKFTSITVPLIVPFILITVVLRGIDSFKVFDMVYVLTGGGPGTLTQSISIYIYKMMFNANDVGRAAAASTILLLVFSIPLGLVLRNVLRREER
ncbi:MAG: sugar ABC transporter permease [Anaerolineae bacterium]|nr:sugar ABC transporter permease [Anaerolineae bacterium]